jgi:hypothetical protein
LLVIDGFFPAWQGQSASKARLDHLALDRAMRITLGKSRLREWFRTAVMVRNLPEACGLPRNAGQSSV